MLQDRSPPLFREEKTVGVGATMYLVSFSIVALLAVLFGSKANSYLGILLQSTSDASQCPLYESLAPVRFTQDNSTVLAILEDETFRLASVARLAGSVQIDTHLPDGLPDVAGAPQEYEKFEKFHRYLAKTYPNIHRVTKLTKVNTYGLVYHWKGSDSSLKPLMLAAHQDVVPVQADTLADWTYPPFDGHYDGKYIYGRGASDCKNLLIASMDAVELLISEGYEPARGVILAFGFDEETSGKYGAKRIGEYLGETYGNDSIYAIIDEGPGLHPNPLTGKLMAMPATGEKGYMDIRVDLRMRGGHSSVPPDHGAIAIMGDLANRIEQDPFTPKLTSENPLLRFMQYAALHAGDKMSLLQKKAILRAGIDKLANSKVVAALGKNPMAKYLVQTSQSADIIRGGEKANALPENVWMLVNHRIAIGDTIELTKAQFGARVAEVARKYNLEATFFGEKLTHQDPGLGKLTVEEGGDSFNSAPVSPSDDTVWKYLARTTRHVFEDVVLRDVIDYPVVTAPSIMPANTDTRRYWHLTRHIYRYSPQIIHDVKEINIHSVDEKVLVDAHLQLTAFYYEYIQNVDTADAQNA